MRHMVSSRSQPVDPIELEHRLLLLQHESLTISIHSQIRCLILIIAILYFGVLKPWLMQ